MQLLNGYDCIILKVSHAKDVPSSLLVFSRTSLFEVGFCQQFVQLIMYNLQASYFSAFINGSPSDYFKATRGVKQGDSLSSYLFILLDETNLVAEGLAKLAA